MEVNRLTLPDSGYASNTGSGSDKVVKPGAEKTGQTVASPEANRQDKPKDDSQVSRPELDELTVELNKFMQSFNADLHFAIHEKTKHLMVQLVDEKQNKVLREYPSHEFLDMIARISDYVGVLLDKKA